MKISQKDVQHVARLARLTLDKQELESMTGQLDAILGYVDKLNQLDTAGIEPMAHAVPMANAFRADDISPSPGIERALQNAPEVDHNCYRVPRVIE